MRHSLCLDVEQRPAVGSKDQSEHSMHNAVHDSHPATGPVMAKMVTMPGVRPIKVNGMWDEDESLGTVECG